MEVGKLWVKLGMDKTDFDKDINNVKSSGGGLGGFLKNAFSTTLGIGMFSAIKTGMKSAWDMAIGYDSALQQNTIAFETMLGSADKAGVLLGELADFAESTPFEFTDLATASKKMLAFGFTAEDVIPMLTSVGDASAGLGMSGSEGVGRIITALGQMKAKAKVSGGEMMQLTEAGIPAWQILADKMGISTAEVMKLSEKGLIPADEAIQQLIEGMGEKFPDMMAKQSKTYAGLMSTLKDTTQSTLGGIVKPMFDNLSTNILPKAIAMVERISEAFKMDGLQGILGVIFPPEMLTTINNLGGVIGDLSTKFKDLVSGLGTGDMWGGLNSFFGFLNDNGAVIGGIISTMAGGMVALKIATIASTLAMKAHNIILAIQGIATGNSNIMMAVSENLKGKNTIAQWLLNTAMSMNPLVIVILAIGALVGAFLYLWNTNEGFRNALIGAWTAIKTFFAGIPTWFGGITASIGAYFTALGMKIAEIWTGIVTFFTGVWAKISAIFTVGVMLIGSIINGVMLVIKTGIQLVWNGILQYFKVYWAVISGIFTYVWSYIGDYVMDAINGIKAVITTVFTAISSFFKTVWGAISNTVSTVAGAILGFITTIFTAIGTFISSIFNKVYSYISGIFTSIRIYITTVVTQIWTTIRSVFTSIYGAISTIMSNIWTSVTGTWNKISSTIGTIITGIKSKVSSIFEGIKSTVTGIFTGIWNNAVTRFNSIRDAIAKPIEKARDLVKSAIDAIKGFFTNLKLPEIKIPKMKLPHFSMKGSFSLAPPSVPSLGVDWYKSGGIFNSPSVIGVGEAGSEVVLPISKLSSILADTIGKLSTVNDTAGTNGVIIHIDSMTVRKESDIEEISELLYKKMESNSRGKGIRR